MSIFIVVSNSVIVYISSLIDDFKILCFIMEGKYLNTEENNLAVGLLQGGS